MVPVIVDIGGRTDPGRDPSKTVNEDAIGHRACKHGYLVVVCDGMGGHEGGKEASAQALAGVLETFEQASEETPPQVVLAAAVAEANRRVFALAPSTDAADRPGSTVVAIVVHAAGTEVAHVGDSRAYAITGGKIAQITKDHSVVQQMVDRGLLTPEDAKGHPDANRITRALGTRDTVEVEVRPSPLLHAPGDVFVLCSDGLSDLVSPDDILRIATSASPEQAAGQLVDLANARGGHDNVSVVVVRAKEGAVARAGTVAKTVAETIADEAPLLLVTPAGAAGAIEARAADSSGRLPQTTIDSTPRRRFSLGVILGLLLVALGLIGAGVAVYLNERTSHTHTAPSASVFTNPSAVGTTTHAPVASPSDTEDPPEMEPVRPLSYPDAGNKPHLPP